MGDIRTEDYVAEYKFKEIAGPRYQEDSLRGIESSDKEEFFSRFSWDMGTDSLKESRENRRTPLIGGDAGNGRLTGNDYGSGGRRNDKHGEMDYQAWRNEREERKRGTRFRKKNRKGSDIRRKTKQMQKGGSKNGGRQSAFDVTGRLKNSVRGAFSDMKQSAENVSGSGGDSGLNSYAYASTSFAEQQKRTDQLAEALRMIFKAVKAVATATFLPILAIMVFVALIVASIVSFFTGDDSEKGQPIENPSSAKQIIYNGLLEMFDGNATAAIGVLCALMAESGCRADATEAVDTWGISAAEYTEQVNKGEVSKEDFVNSIYNGVQGSRGYGIAQWSTVDRKTGLYEYAVSWAKDREKAFDIADIDMQVAHLRETINTGYQTLKEELIKETSVEEACYKWISTYEKPSQKNSTWREKAARDVEKFEVDLRKECNLSVRKTGNGIFLWPCPSGHKITSYFGNRVAPKAGASTNHKGIDIGASMGDKVIAAADGKVTTVSYNSARGYFIVINHGKGYVTLYQHLSRMDVTQGATVEAGQQIGAVGDTGISTAPHLHFEVHVNGTPVDPLQYYE